MIELAVVNPNAGGIDVGSKSYFVSIGQNRKEDVKEFVVYSEDLRNLSKWLLENHIDTVAMESIEEFTSWLRLAPNNKVSGGKALSKRTPKGNGRLKIALRNAANAIGDLKEGHLARFFKRIAFKKGRQIAITATARKLAMIIWNMVTKNQEYNPPEEYMFLDQKRKLSIARRMGKKINKLGLTTKDLGLST